MGDPKSALYFHITAFCVLESTFSSQLCCEFRCAKHYLTFLYTGI